MKSNVSILIGHDLAVAVKNKTFILLVCIPLFVYGTLTLVDAGGGPGPALKIAFLQPEFVNPVIRGKLETVPALFSIRVLESEEAAKRLLKEKVIDAVVMSAPEDPESVEVLVLRKDSSVALAVFQRFSALQIASTGNGKNWLTGIESLQADSLNVQSLPTWILMVVLLVAFFVVPAQVAEEKEKQWLSGLLQTPMGESDWLAAKLLYGILLMALPLLALHLLGKSLFLSLSYGTTLFLGSFCFSALGVMLGLLCRSQASARTLGVVFYLPMLLPIALADTSQILGAVARFLPSYALYEPVQSVLLNGGETASFPLEWLILLTIGTTATLISHRLIKARWLM
jgi:ABC-2 type transport system permease protein